MSDRALRPSEWGDLGKEALTIVADLATAKGLSNVQKRRKAEAILAERVDQIIEWGDTPMARVLEALDGVVIKLLITMSVESAYGAWKAAQAKTKAASAGADAATE